jgi:branched-chain amino acid aminotransferase
MFACVNGTLVDEPVAGVAVWDHGFTVGDGVFETIAVRDGRAIAVTRHLCRLARSAAGLGLPPPDLPELHRAVGVTVAANPGIPRGAIRVTHTSGPGPVGSGRGELESTTVVAVREVPAFPPWTDVITVPWPRNERGALAGLKTTSYAENVLALATARRHGAGEAIFANTRGNLCEGSGTNVFMVVDGELVTPPLDAGCLAGVTRALLIERCGIDVAERDVPLEALAGADEAWLSSAMRDVQPIRAVDSRPLGRCPGPATTAAAEAYAALLLADPDPEEPGPQEQDAVGGRAASAPGAHRAERAV